LNVEGTNSNSGENVAETAFVLQMTPGFSLDLLVQDYYAFMSVSDIQVKNAFLVENNAGLYHRDYDTLFGNLIQTQVDTLIDSYGKEGMKLIEDKKTYNIVDKYFSNSTLTTQQFDEFLYVALTPSSG
jgi:hypothetical protein